METTPGTKASIPCMMLWVPMAIILSFSIVVEEPVKLFLFFV